MNKTIVVIAIFIQFIPSVSWSQTSGTGSPGLSTALLVRAPDYHEIQSSWADGIEVAQWWVKKFAQQRIRTQIEKISLEAISESSSFVEWTNQGVLYEIRVARSKSEDLNGWYNAMVLGGKAIKAGVGANPVQALFAHYSKDQLKEAIPDGYMIDDSLSGYFFVKTNSKGKVEAKVVSRGTVLELREQVRNAYGDLELAYQLEKLQDTDSWQAIAKAAKKRIADANTKFKVDMALKEVLLSQSNVRDANEKLRNALEQERRTSAVLQQLNILRNVIDAASLANTVIKELNIPSNQLEGANTPDAVIKVVEETKTKTVTLRKTLELSIQDGSFALQNSLDLLWDKIQPGNPPPDVRTPLLLSRPK